MIIFDPIPVAQPRKSIQKLPFFESFDSDTSDYLDEQEFGEGLFWSWDLNHDRVVAVDEWESCHRDWGVSEEFTAIPDQRGVKSKTFMKWYEDIRLFENWDIDGNRKLSRQEFEQSSYQFKNSGDDPKTTR